MTHPKEMLSALLQRGQLKPQEQEVFENMWDALHRYGRLTAKQKAWVEREYFGRKLDRTPTPASTPAATPKGASPQGHTKRTIISPVKKHYRLGTIDYAGTKDVLLVTNMNTLRELCPGIAPGSPSYVKIEAFFRNGGEVLKVKPAPLKKTE